MGIFSIFSKKNKDESSEIKKNEESVKVQTNDDVLSENKEKIVSDYGATTSDSKNNKESNETNIVEDSLSNSNKEEQLDKQEEKLVDVKESVNTEDDNKGDNDPKKEKVSFFERLKRTRENLAFGIGVLVTGKKIDDELYEDLETSLLTADLGVDTTNNIIERLREESKIKELRDAGALKNNLKNLLKDILVPCSEHLKVEKQGDLPFVILMVGVNGAGKTTTIGKLALKYKAQGKKVMLAAGDTFRAAAVEQLKEWGNRTDTPVISQPTGSDSASVIFDALTSAKAHNADVLICDTAGRLQNKDNLMEELKKIVRVMKKIDENVPNEVMLVLDATTGQNAVSQMKIFGQAVNVTGLCLTKLDGTAKGGVVFALADKFKVPLRYIGIGEKSEDLREFDIDSFVDALFD
ncbi:MAG: signal recognition particle-docking protein FtsY [Succinivibrio sp.]|nr:signal recognition particle-docking protein FtsY [Succinivibrio sp.]MDY5064391.1 signal recognition particle-docking protein FtsY [Succinivibrio sp.]MDY5995273.1 signal recognition particle-docking protein FtsY [Succinivibrio sp.]PWM82263.1 MAG: signal recognition particle-docking protein FtsY [Succinivibrio sp.]